MKSLTDILSYSDVKFLVKTFYEKVKHDKELGDIFKEMRDNKWNDHVATMSTYWNALILEKKHEYAIEFRKYAKLPIGEKYFQRWTFLFFETVNENFAGTNADEAKLMAIKIALYFEPSISPRHRSRNLTARVDNEYST